MKFKKIIQFLSKKGISIFSLFVIIFSNIVPYPYIAHAEDGLSGDINTQITDNQVASGSSILEFGNNEIVSDELNSGNALINSGDVLNNSGDALNNSGDVLNNSGDALNNSGDALINSGDALINSGDALINSGDALIENKILQAESISISLDSNTNITDSNNQQIHLEQLSLNIHDSLENKIPAAKTRILQTLETKSEDVSYIKFDFGIDGKHLIFSEPVKIELNTTEENGGIFDIQVKHEGDLDFNTHGLSTDPNTKCTETGAATKPSNQAIISDGKVVFYTCGASVYNLTYIGGENTTNFVDKETQVFSKTLNTNSQVNDISISVTWRSLDSIGNPLSAIGTDNCHANEKEFTLISPSGTRVQLFAAETFNNPTNCPTVTHTFSDSANTTLSVGTDYSTSNGAIYVPAEPLSNFNGENSQGIWNLEITDTTGLDGMYLKGFELSIDVNPLCTIEYSPGATQTTNQNVVATLTGCDETINVVNNSFSNQYTFTENGNFSFWYEDSDGNTGSQLATITWIDKTAPILTGNFDIMTVPVGATPDYLAGISANDNIDGDVTSSILVDSSNIDLNTQGTYPIVYSVTDAAGNTTSITRDINVSMIYYTDENNPNNANITSSTNWDVNFSTTNLQSLKVVVNGSAYYVKSPTLGTNVSTPAKSCRDIKDLVPSSTNGVYYINPDGTTFQVYCDMTNGGRMLLDNFKGSKNSATDNYTAAIGGSNIKNATDLTNAEWTHNLQSFDITTYIIKQDYLHAFLSGQPVGYMYKTLPNYANSIYVDWGKRYGGVGSYSRLYLNNVVKQELTTHGQYDYNSNYSKNTTIKFDELGIIYVGEIFVWEKYSNVNISNTSSNDYDNLNYKYINLPSGTNNYYVEACYSGGDCYQPETRTANVASTTITNPSISLNGNNPQYIEFGDSYSELGASAYDPIQGDLTSSISTNSTAINIGALGTYNVSYSVTNSSGKSASVNRTVIIRDTIEPTITLVGDSIINLGVGGIYEEPGYTTSDNHSTNPVVISGTVNTSVAGTYFIDYTVTDDSGNFTTTQRVVNILDSSISYSQTTPTNQDVTVTITDSKNINIPGWSCTNNTCTKVYTQNITETVTITDQYNNSYQMTISISNIDKTAPILTGNFDIMTVPVGATPDYLAGISANDDVDGDITSSILVDSSNIDLNTQGTYPIIYSVTDAAGNTTSVTRDINVSMIYYTDENNPNNANITSSTNWDVNFSTTNLQSLKVVVNGSAYYVKSPTLGTNVSTPAKSCRDIKDLIPSSTNGVYYINPDGTTFQVYCDMTNGGRMLLDNFKGSKNSATDNYTKAIGGSNIKNATDLTNAGWNYYMNAFDSSAYVIKNDYLQMFYGSTPIGYITKSLPNYANSIYVDWGNWYTNSYSTLDINDIEVQRANANAGAKTYNGNYNKNSSIKFEEINVSIFWINEIFVWEKYSNVNISNTSSTEYDNLNYKYINLPSGTNNYYVEACYSGGDCYQPETRTANVASTTITNPSISLNGNNPQYIEFGDPYIDLGASAYDPIQGDITSSIVTNPATVNALALGTYSANYSITNSSGKSTSVNRTVIVRDTTEPTISLIGDSTINLGVGDTYNELGYTSSDNHSTNPVVVSGTVNTSVAGTYFIDYTVTDDSGNFTTTQRVVNVIDNDGPVITLSGSANITIELGTTYTDLGASAFDNSDGDLTNSIITSNTVDTTKIGTYNIYYNVSDSSGNTATEMIRTITVVDTQNPIMTLNGANPQYIEFGSSYSELGASASDPVDGSLTNKIKINSTNVNAGILGTYSVHYYVEDSSGNPVSLYRQVIVRDSTAPIITLVGNNNLTIEYGSIYNDDGATAFDSYDGNITSNITTVNPVNTSQTGTYYVTYNVSDSNGNDATQITRTVTVVDTQSPVLTILGSNPQYIEFGTSYSELGASAFDVVDGDLSSSIISDTSDVDTTSLGTYTAIYSVTDINSNTTTGNRTVIVQDTTNPTITLSGDNPMNLEVFTIYNEPGYTTSDNHSTNPVVISGAVNTGVVGTYFLDYTLTDNSGNSTTVQRVVNIVDTTAPVITLSGDNPMYVELGSSYNEPGASANDNLDGDLTSNISITGTVNSNQTGTYYVKYNVTDSNGNSANEITRTIIVQDTVAPIITLNGSGNIIVEYGSTYNDNGASAFDVSDPNITANIVVNNPVNTNQTGIYYVTYNVSDSNGNDATQITRTVTVVDTQSPVLTILGSNPQYIEFGTSYSELGASAFDVVDGDLSSSIISDTSDVDTTSLGTYTAIYSVTDINSNTTTGNRTVIVQDTTNPTITLSGDNPMNLEVFTIYNEPGYTTSDNHSTNPVVISGAVNTGVVGTYFLDYTLTDDSGNSTTVQRIVNIVDTTAPVIDISQDPAIPTNEDVTINTSVTDNIFVSEVKWAKGIVTIPDFSATGTTLTSTGSDSFTVGENGYYTVYAIDSEGNESVNIIQVTNIDKIAPIITEYNIDILSGGIHNPVITFSGTDNVGGLGLSGFYFCADSTCDDISEYTEITSSYTANLNSSLPYHSVYLRACDVAGNCTTQVKHYPPVLNITSPTTDSNDNITGVVITIEGPAGLFVDNIIFSGSASHDFTLASCVNSGGTALSLPSDLPVTCNGTITDTGVLEIIASNSNISGSTSQTYNIDRVNPTCQVAYSPSNTSETNQNVVAQLINCNEAITVTNNSGTNKLFTSDGSFVFEFEDWVGNTGSITSNVTWIDKENPTITLNGDETIYIELGNNYVESGAIASDNKDTAIQSKLITTGTVDTNVPGTYTIRYNVTDEATNSADQKTRTVIVQDTIKPIITLTGANPQYIEIGSSYSELSASVNDNYYGDISNTLQIDSSNVNVSLTGTYTVTYNATDSNGNSADQKTRTIIVQDTTKPVITLNGSGTVYSELGATYNDLGAIGFDSYYGSLTSLIDTTNLVNTNQTGTYTVTYNLTDLNGNIADEVTRTVIIQDTTIPIIILTGANPQYVEIGNSYSELGAIVTDTVYGDISEKLLTNSGSVNLTQTGTYIVTYNATDYNGNNANEITRTIVVQDTTKPIITVVGDHTIYVEVGSSYSDSGAIASDNYYGNISNKLQTTNPVNTNQTGTYTIEYDVIDLNGNSATQKTRTVIVQDTIKPIITLTGANPQYIEIGSFYSELSASVNDNYYGDISNTLQIDSSNVNVSLTGTYTVTYNATDSNGNSADQKTRTIIVQDTTKPVITLNGSGTVYSELGATYNDLGAIGLDNHYGNLTSLIDTTIPVNTNQTGTYIVTYNLTDLNGNIADEVTRTVIIQDTTIPIITLTGANPQYVEIGNSYFELGAFVTDTVYGDISSTLVISGTIDEHTLGNYTIEYNATDLNGNDAISITRTVIVQDNSIPVITLSGANPQYIEYGNNYVEQGAVVIDNYYGDISSNLVINTGALNLSGLGSYDITYNAIDDNGNHATQQTRTVIVQDTTAPSMILNGSGDISIPFGGTYTELGAQSYDLYDGDISSGVVITGSVNTSLVGTYTISYSSTDSNGNRSIIYRTITVEQDIILPPSGGGGGGSSLTKDKCPDGDFSDSYYDGICEDHNITDIIDGGDFIDFGDIDLSDLIEITDEVKYICNYADELGYKTECLELLNKNNYLTRIEMAELTTLFAVKELNKSVVNYDPRCLLYDDISDLNTQEKLFAIASCELGIMGLHANGVTPKDSFDPHDFVTRAEFGTVLSRLLRGNTYAPTGDQLWYEGHLKALKQAGIMNYIDNPYLLELESYAVLMLYRLSQDI